jgi:hypothetical protein
VLSVGSEMLVKMNDRSEYERQEKEPLIMCHPLGYV